MGALGGEYLEYLLPFGRGPRIAPSRSGGAGAMPTGRLLQATDQSQTHGLGARMYRMGSGSGPVRSMNAQYKSFYSLPGEKKAFLK